MAQVVAHSPALFPEKFVQACRGGVAVVGPGGSAHGMMKNAPQQKPRKLIWAP